MINLLPKDTKQTLRAARMNVMLVRYLFFFGFSILFMLAIFGVGYYITTTDRERAKQELSELEATSVQYAAVKKEAEEFEQNLSTAKTILANEVIFSDLVVDIAKSLPSGALLSDLNLTTATFGESIIINARTRDPEGGLRLKSALQESAYFDNVSIQSITNPATAAGNQDTTNRITRDYPYVVVMSATLLKTEKDKTERNTP